MSPRSMRSWSVVAFLALAAAGTPAHAESSEAPKLPARVGVDGIAGIGMFELVGGAVRFENPASATTVVILRAGHLQVRAIEGESQELHPLFFGHLGVRRYVSWFYFSVEGGVIAGSASQGYGTRPNAAVTLGGKAGSVELGISVMPLAFYGISLGAHLGIDLAVW